MIVLLCRAITVCICNILNHMQIQNQTQDEFSVVCHVPSDGSWDPKINPNPIAPGGNARGVVSNFVV